MYVYFYCLYLGFEGQGCKKHVNSISCCFTKIILEVTVSVIKKSTQFA